jgi:hypothetical protein
MICNAAVLVLTWIWHGRELKAMVSSETVTFFKSFLNKSRVERSEKEGS